MTAYLHAEKVVHSRDDDIDSRIVAGLSSQVILKIYTITSFFFINIPSEVQNKVTLIVNDALNSKIRVVKRVLFFSDNLNMKSLVLSINHQLTSGRPGFDFQPHKQKLK